MIMIMMMFHYRASSLGLEHQCWACVRRRIFHQKNTCPRVVRVSLPSSFSVCFHDGDVFTQCMFWWCDVDTAKCASWCYDHTQVYAWTIVGPIFETDAYQSRFPQCVASYYLSLSGPVSGICAITDTNEMAPAFWFIFTQILLRFPNFFKVNFDYFFVCF